MKKTIPIEEGLQAIAALEAIDPVTVMAYDVQHHGFVDHLSGLTLHTVPTEVETEHVGNIDQTNVLDKLFQVGAFLLPENHQGENWVSIGLRLRKALNRVGAVRHRQLQLA